MKLEPVTVSVRGPLPAVAYDGFRLATDGPVTYVKPPVRVAVPPGVVTTTFLAPAVPAGVTAVSEVALPTTTPVAGLPPIARVVSPAKNPVPVTVTAVPPAVVPEFGVIPPIDGAPRYVKPPASVPVPADVVTATSFGPAVPMGVTAVKDTALPTTTPVASRPPIVTVVAPATKPDPAIVTAVPPPSGPAAGVMPVTVGAPM